MNQNRTFQKIATTIFMSFILMFVLLIVIAYRRESGFAGMDMSKVQKIRHDASQIVSK